MEELKLLIKKQKEHDKPKKIQEETVKLDDGTKVKFPTSEEVKDQTPKEDKPVILPKQPEIKTRFVSRGKFDYSKYFK